MKRGTVQGRFRLSEVASVTIWCTRHNKQVKYGDEDLEVGSDNIIDLSRSLCPGLAPELDLIELDVHKDDFDPRDPSQLADIQAARDAATYSCTSSWELVVDSMSETQERLLNRIAEKELEERND